jgi:hypothetical protein
MALFRRPLLKDPLRDGRHPDLIHRVDSLLPGRSISVPGIFLVSAALALVGCVGLAVYALLNQPAHRSWGALTGMVVITVISAVMLLAAAILLSKGLRWRAARRRYAERNGGPDLGYFQAWDGRRSEAVVRAEAEATVRANRSRD